jgi:hypothetical protein
VSDPPNNLRNTILFDHIDRLVDAETRAARLTGELAAANSRIATLEKDLETARGSDRSAEVADLTQRLANAEAARDAANARADKAENDLRAVRPTPSPAPVVHPPPPRGPSGIGLVLLLLIIGLVVAALWFTQDRWVPWLQSFADRPAVVAEEPIDNPPAPRTDITVSGMVLAPPANEVERAFREDCAAHSGTLYTAEEWTTAL